MDKKAREDYTFQKKCLLVLLFLYYLNNIGYDDITLRSFGFHFDPTCNFKAIVISKKEHIHKYVVHIFNTMKVDDLKTLDVMGNVNIIKVPAIDGKEFQVPDAALNVYFDGVDFNAIGYIEGAKFSYATKTQKPVMTDELLYHLNNDKDCVGKNDSAPNFLLWLLKLYTSRLHVDLIMGAGINEDYGAKNWSELLSALNAEFYQGNETLQAEIKHYVGKELFTSSMVLKTSGFDIYKSLCHELYEFKEAKSFNDPDSTLYKCVDYIARHPGISVITYNYDTNLEYLLKKRDLKYTTVYDDNSFVTKDAVCDIYHVHGLIPYEKYDQRKFTDSVIFNESDYYYLYNNPYCWPISKQLHDFKFNTCIFIGISLTDPDMKRLLDVADNPLKFNFIFVKKNPDYSEAVFRDITTYFFAFDLITIWIDDYPEIGTWLAAL
jgi:hypothetical protein